MSETFESLVGILKTGPNVNLYKSVAWHNIKIDRQVSGPDGNHCQVDMQQGYESLALAQP
jgi:hypothetical protein